MDGGKISDVAAITTRVIDRFAADISGFIFLPHLLHVASSSCGIVQAKMPIISTEEICLSLLETADAWFADDLLPSHIY